MKNTKSVIGWIGLVVLWSVVVWAIAFGRGRQEAASAALMEINIEQRLDRSLHLLERRVAALENRPVAVVRQPAR